PHSLALLRARRDRPCYRRAAEQCDELAPLHASSNLRASNGLNWDIGRAWHVRFGSKADMCGAKEHVRFAPESDIKCGIVECPLWANSGHCAPYSITSSARPISVFGAVRASAFAVLRLIASSYLVGACTGRSAGFSPLRMRST